MSLTHPRCAFCGQAAACFGNYDSAVDDYACDQCCWHGNEDGWCKSILCIEDNFRTGEPCQRVASWKDQEQDDNLCVPHLKARCRMGGFTLRNNGTLNPRFAQVRR
jgi:hypothetical protein